MADELMYRYGKRSKSFLNPPEADKFLIIKLLNADSL